ncbi:MoxR family ATPase [Butyrivibrio sp. DSM 10294]|uniref:AAA family ATPase n=1 Tax=Butyrivibrio sp. DSM 10294 TaxID=2972457 RepID=UPI00234F76A2|nr:MoxR family ATPase [Butyrivibrio sp. DSM 10294]MDC7294751.1 MoxR family ATPase [Butyrivibrio sp. DSM 10294]
MNEQANTGAKSAILESEYHYSQEVIKKLSDYFDAKVVGQQQLKFSLIAAILADGHILVESVPGLAKTTAAKAISDAVDGQFARIQCTPDLLPGDIVGTQIYNQANGKFETILGPVFANFVLLDEVNRSSAKTQSAMLEAMQEKHVTIGGTTYNMPEDVFIVIATQNPIEQEGTYPLSEAQTDRFIIKEVITYPLAAEEVEILNRIESGVISRVDPAVLTIKDIDQVQDIVDKVYVDESIKWYISSIIVASRRASQIQGLEIGKYVRIGASPRASIAFLKMAKASALMHGRTYVTPDDVKMVRHQVLRHRIGLNYSAVADNITVEQVIDGIVNSVKTP